MSANNHKDIIFILTQDDILTCARQLKMTPEQLTDETIGLVKDKLAVEFSRWPEIVKEILIQATRCPLGLACFPSCCWWKEGRCIFPR